MVAFKDPSGVVVVEVDGFWDIEHGWHGEVFAPVGGFFEYDGIVYEFTANASMVGWDDWELEWDGGEAYISDDHRPLVGYDNVFNVPLSLIESAEVYVSPFDSETFEAVRDDYLISMQRNNPLSRHYIPPKKKSAESWTNKHGEVAEAGSFRDGTGCISQGSFPGLTCEYCGFDPHDLVYYQCKQNDEDLTWDEWQQELEFYFYEGSHSEQCQGLIDEMDAKEAEDEIYGVCPYCGYEPPQNYELGDAYCYDCEYIVRASEVSEHADCDLDIMDEEGLRSEMEFWLYENHPDFCEGMRNSIKEADYTIDMINSHGIKWSGEIKEKKEAETFEASADDYGDLEYIILELLTDAQLEAEYGEVMDDYGIGRDDLPQKLEDEYRTSEEAEYLRGKYLQEEEAETFEATDWNCPHSSFDILGSWDQYSVLYAQCNDCGRYGSLYTRGPVWDTKGHPTTKKTYNLLKNTPHSPEFWFQSGFRPSGAYESETFEAYNPEQPRDESGRWISDKDEEVPTFYYWR